MLADIGKALFLYAFSLLAFYIGRRLLLEDPSQPINFDEFCEMMKGRMPDKNSRAEIDKALRNTGFFYYYY